MGRPGSVRRWFLGSAVVLLFCAYLFVRADLIGRVGVFILGAALVFMGWRARAFVVGDEDEVWASVRRILSQKRPVQPAADEVALDPEELQRRLAFLEGRFGDAPAPPILDGADEEQ